MTDTIDETTPDLSEVKKLENPLEQTVLPEGPLKQLIVDYVGNKVQPQNNMVTLEMIIGTVADEFPEFVFGLAEENFLRGYNQALKDLEAMQQQPEQIKETTTIDE